MRQYVVDFDDLCDTVADRAYDQLCQVKEKYPDFTATLFTIPNRTSTATIEKFAKQKWLALAPHGWHHTRGECLAWSLYEATEKLKMAKDKGVDAPAFRAPAWLINRSCYDAAMDLNLTVCDHVDNYLHVPGCRVYRYNDPIGRLSCAQPIHGHLTNTNAIDNYIGDMLDDGRLTFADKRAFMWPWEAAVELTMPSKEASCES